jgi:Cation/multidrug efflux pump
MNRGYEMTLAWVMRHHVTTMVVSLVVLWATFHMFGLVPKGFIPSEDTGQLLINTEGAQGVSFDQMVRNQQQLAAIVGKDANVESFSRASVWAASVCPATRAGFSLNSKRGRSGP